MLRDGTKKAGPWPTKKQGSARLFCVFGVASLLGELVCTSSTFSQTRGANSGGKYPGQPAELHHAAHAAHSAHAAVTGDRGFFLLGDLGDEAFGGEEQTGDGRGVLEGAARDLLRVDDAGLEEVDVFAGGNVVAFGALAREDLVDHHAALETAVGGEGAEGFFDGAADDVGADGLIAGELQGIEGLDGAEQGDAAAGDDAFFHGRTGGVEGVFDACLLLLHLGLGGRADVDDGDAAGELGEAFLEFFTVVVAGGLFDLLADLVDACEDVGLLAGAFDDRGVFLLDGDAFGLAELVEADGVELDAEVFGDQGAAREDGDVFEHGFAAVAEAGGLHGADVQRAAHLVDDERGERFTLDVLRDDEQGLAGLGDGLQHGEHVVEVGDLLLVDEDVGILEGAGHLFGVVHEIGGEVALVELHAFDDVEGGLDGLGLFDGDGAVLADLVHGVGDDLADLGIAVGGDGGDLGDLFALADIFLDGVEFGDDGFDGLVDAALQAHRIRAGGDVLQALLEDGLGEDGGGGGAVAGDIAGLAGDFTDHLCAHVLEGVLEFDLLGDADAVLGDQRGAEFLVEDDIASAGAEGGLDGGGELFDAGKKLTTGFVVEKQLFSSHDMKSPVMNQLKCGWCQPTMARMSLELRILYSLSLSLISVPPYLLVRTMSPTFTSNGAREPSSLSLPVPRAMTFADMGFSLAVSGM